MRLRAAFRSCRSCRLSRGPSRCSRRAAPTRASSAAPARCAVCVTARSSATGTDRTSASRNCWSTPPRIPIRRSSLATSKGSRTGSIFCGRSKAAAGSGD
jgi:hypothetical protein